MSFFVLTTEQAKGGEYHVLFGLPGRKAAEEFAESLGVVSDIYELPTTDANEAARILAEQGIQGNIKVGKQNWQIRGPE